MSENLTAYNCVAKVLSDGKTLGVDYKPGVDGDMYYRPDVDAELAALRAENARLNSVLDQVNASTERIEAGVDRVAGYNAALRAELAAVKAEREKWRALVMAHNSALEIKCRSWQSGGYCSAPGRPHACHDCPRDWRIDVPHNLGEGEAK